MEQHIFFEKVFGYFRTGLGMSDKAIVLLEKFNVPKDAEVGYNSANFHIKMPDLVPQCLETGLLTIRDKGGHKCFAKHGLVFPIRNRQQNITGFYGISSDGITQQIGDGELPVKLRPVFFKAEQSDNHTEPVLETIHEHKLLFNAGQIQYFILGAISQDLSTLRVTLMAEDILTGRKERARIDLYDHEHIRKFSDRLSEFSQHPFQRDLHILTDLAEAYREKQLVESMPSQKNKQVTLLPAQEQKKCIEFLSKADLLSRIDALIEKSGVVGEQGARKTLFLIASSYKMSSPLHALVQGTSGSGKSHLINSIADCFPPEDILSLTRVSPKSLYHYGKDELVGKLVLIQDFDGMNDDAQFAFREMQSAGSISSSITYKDRNGNLQSTIKTVKASFASLIATTHGEVYMDNMSRSVIVGVDESERQTQNIISYHNKKLAGVIDLQSEREAKVFLQNCIRCLKSLEVVNQYAGEIILPKEARMQRRLNSQFQAFVRQVTILHQYQRQKDDLGRIIATKEDLLLATDLMMDSIMLKVDDLDPMARQFFESLKTYIDKQASGNPSQYTFSQREIRQSLSLSKTQCFRYFEQLERMEYIQKCGGHKNRGFFYKIIHLDDIHKIRKQVKQTMFSQFGSRAEALEHQTSR